MKKSMFDKIKDIPACNIVAMDELKLHSLEQSFVSEAKWLLSRKTKLEKEMSIPSAITMRQAKLHLLALNLLDSVEIMASLIAGLYFSIYV